MEQLVIKIAGIGQVTSALLTKHGFKTVADIANASVESLSVVSGFASARSLQTIKKAKELLQTADVSISKEVTDSVVSKEKEVIKKPIKNKKAAKESKNKAEKVSKNKKKEINRLKLEVKKLASKLAKLKDKAKKTSKKTAKKKKTSKKIKKK